MPLLSLRERAYHRGEQDAEQKQCHDRTHQVDQFHIVFPDRRCRMVHGREAEKKQHNSDDGRVGIEAPPQEQDKQGGHGRRQIVQRGLDLIPAVRFITDLLGTGFAQY